MKGILSVMLGGPIPQFATESDIRQRLLKFLKLDVAGENVKQQNLENLGCIDFDEKCNLICFIIFY